MIKNVKEVAEELHVSVGGVYNWVSQRKIPFVKLGGHLRFDSDEIKRWIDKNKTKETERRR